MSRERLREILFASHSVDLQDVIPDFTTEVISDLAKSFICPICMHRFYRDGIYDQTLTDGHIWPKAIRRQSEQANHLRVLLCHSCNSTLGTRGDAQMQIREKVKETAKHGDYGERRVEILFEPGEQPITLNGIIKFPDLEKRTDIVLSFPWDAKRKQWARNDPKEQRRFKEIQTTNQRISMIVHPHPELRSDVARVGWLTAAYLSAFHAFGYRYIFQSELEPVRQVILESFKDDRPVFPESDVLQVRQCTEHYAADPQIAVTLPLDGKTPVYLQIDFRDYHIRLPFPCVPMLLQALLETNMSGDFIIPDTADAAVGMGILCTKIEPHDCTWDYVMGKSLSIIE